MENPTSETSFLFFSRKQIVKGIFNAVVTSVFFFTLYFLLVGRLLQFPWGIAFSALFSFLMLLCIGSLNGAIAKYSELRAMFRALKMDSTTELQDGQTVVFFGQIHSNSGQPMISPITQARCVMYTYDVYQWVWTGTGKQRTQEKRSDYTGACLIPSTITTNLGNIPLFAVPILQGFTHPPYSYSEKTSEVYNNLHSYIQATTFKEVGKDIIGLVVNTYTLLKNSNADDCGFIRNDTKHATESFDLKERFLEEEYVLEGEDVCLLGVWSSTKQGVVGRLNKNAATLTRGKPTEAIRTAKLKALKMFGSTFAFFAGIHFMVAIFWIVVPR